MVSGTGGNHFRIKINKMNIKLSQKLKMELKKLNIGAVYFFGSRAEGKIHPLSDFDVGIVFNDFYKTKKNISEIYDDLFCLFLKEFKIKDEEKLDLVFLQEAPFSLQYKAIAKGKILYCENQEFLADYEEYVLNRYFDFQPVEKEFSQTLLSASLSV